MVHEWGTFTSVQGSNGKVLEGLQHEEEALPEFVYGRDRLPLLATDSLRSVAHSSQCVDPPCCKFHCKAFERLLSSGTPTGVTQKLETPVLYFYSPKDQHVSVNVDFPSGIISQWYPAAQSFSPAVGTIRELADGHMSWEADLTKADSRLAPVEASSIWAPSRRVNSDYVKIGSESERFIFYRGLGRFDLPIAVRATARAFEIENSSDDAIPAAFLLRVQGGRGVVRALGGLKARELRTSAALGAVAAEPGLSADYVGQASRQVAAALIASGLTADESQAMVDTWSRSYFRTEGTRILYVVPRAWTDRLLPLKLTPKPDRLVRTLVGRIEIVDSTEEAQLLASIRANPTGFDTTRLGRFAEPKLRRALELAPVWDGALRDAIQKLLAQAAG